MGQVVSLPKQPERDPATKANLSMSVEVIHTEPLSAGKASTLSIRKPSLFYFMVKRLCDIVLSAGGIIFLLPVFLCIALWIKLDDGGPILHFREIVGKHGKKFYALKFRTMIPDADGYLARHPELMQKFKQNMKLMHDPRITRVGRFLRKTSLDELPQLFNVVMGQM